MSSKHSSQQGRLAGMGAPDELPAHCCPWAACSQHTARRQPHCWKQLDESSFSLCCAPVSGISSAHGAVMCRLDTSHVPPVAVLARASQQRRAFVSGWLLDAVSFQTALKILQG